MIPLNSFEQFMKYCIKHFAIKNHGEDFCQYCLPELKTICDLKQHHDEKDLFKMIVAHNRKQKLAKLLS